MVRSSLIDAIHRLENLEHISILYLNEHDIVRHPLVQKIVKAYEDEERQAAHGIIHPESRQAIEQLATLKLRALAHKRKRNARPTAFPTTLTPRKL